MKITNKFKNTMRELGRQARRDDMSAENARIFFGVYGMEGYWSLTKAPGSPKPIIFMHERAPKVKP